MKKPLLYFFLIFFCESAQAQRNDNIWQLSANYFQPNLYYHLDFSSGQPDTIMEPRELYFFNTNSCVSDSSGEIQFYTNGIWIANKNHDTLSNSQNFNPGWLTTDDAISGLGTTQGVIAFPFNDVSSKYYLVHESAEIFFNADSTQDLQPFNLSYSVVDMSLDSGRGGIMTGLKNVHIINDTLLLGRITACKHANGRDWWVVVHKYNSDIYYKILFTPYGIYGPYSQQIGSFFPAKTVDAGDFDVVGMACFSPDGSKYITAGPSRILDVLDFDRCNGVFSNPRIATIPINPGYRGVLGCSFSPDSRFIYVNTLRTAYQYDSNSSDINNSGIVIALNDSFGAPFYAWFFINQLGPDGKIYISTYNGTYFLHVVQDPDSIGINCNFTQHSLNLPQTSGGNLSVPNFPNYRLGPLAGSPCDTLSLSIAEFSEKDIGINISPNPNSGNFIINYTLPQNKSGILEIFDVLGKRVYAQALPPWSVMQRIDAVALPQGMYVCVVRSEGVSKGVKWVKE